MNDEIPTDFLDLNDAQDGIPLHSNQTNPEGICPAIPHPSFPYRFSSFVRRLMSTSRIRIVANISVDSAYIVGLTPSFVDE